MLVLIKYWNLQFRSKIRSSSNLESCKNAFLSKTCLMSIIQGDISIIYYSCRNVFYTKKLFNNLLDFHKHITITIYQTFNKTLEKFRVAMI